MIVEELTSSGQAEYDAYVEAHSRSNCYHLSAWARVATRAYGHATPYLVARDRPSGSITGVLPLFVVSNPLGRYVTSAMFGGYGPLLADTADARQSLIARAMDLTWRVRAGHLTLKALDEPACPPCFVQQDSYAIATMPLAGSADALWKGLRDKSRNAVRKAMKQELVLREGLAELPYFYDVLAQNYHRKGTPIYGLAMLRELAAALPRQVEILTLRKDGLVISGALLLYHKDVVNVPFCSSRSEFFKLNPNNLLYWEIMRRAIARGIKVLDFGRSPAGASTMAFKLYWGATQVPQPCFVYSTGRKARYEPMSSEDLVARLGIHIWQHLPRPVADRLGPWVHGHFLA